MRPGAPQFIIGRMLKNDVPGAQFPLRGIWALAFACAVAGAGCQATGPAKDRGYSGTIEFEEVRLSFEASGRLHSRAVERGDRVAAGQTVATLNDSFEVAARAAQEGQVAAAEAQVKLLRAGPKPEDVQALVRRVEAARAGEEMLRSNLQRDEQLLARGVIAQAPVDTLRREVERAAAERGAIEAQLQSLKRGARREEVKVAEAQAKAASLQVDLEDERMGRVQLRSPSAGIVVGVHARPGEVVSTGAPIVTIADQEHPLVTVFVPEGKVGGLHLNQAATITTDSLPAGIQGQIEHIAAQTEFAPRYIWSDQERPRLVVRVRVRVHDPAHKLLAGVPAFIRFGAP